MNGSDRDIRHWDVRLKQQLERSFHNYHKRRIDLSVARDNKQYNWTGETIIVEKASSADAIATVRLMFDDADELTLQENVEIKSIFNRLYISNEVQADEWLDVIAGINFEYKKKIAKPGGGIGLLKTGQTISYQDGDDGDYEAGIDHDYVIKTIAGDDVVIDNVTGLMWAGDGDAAGCNNGVAINWSDALIYAEALNFAGFDDWRLPNIRELASLVNFGLNNPCLEQPPFVNVYSAYYWSSTTDLTLTTKAWMNSFWLGDCYVNLKTIIQKILCVRGGL